MPLRIQFGNPKGDVNVFCYVPLGRCKLLRIAAFAEQTGVSRLFYGVLLDSLRSWVRASYLQVPSSRSWWGRRRRDITLAPKLAIRATSNALLYDVSSAGDLKALINVFWHRSPLRLYGTDQNDLATARVDVMLDRQLLEACSLLAAEDLRFVAERDTWGFFPNVLFAAADSRLIATKVESAAGVLSSPIRYDDSAFRRFPIRFPGTAEHMGGPAGAER
jgi:hypothetical protein